MSSSKSKKTMYEVPCESPFPSRPTGCCIDGRKCDEICVAIAAEEDCKKAGYVHEEEEVACQQKCCNKKTKETASVCNSGNDHCRAESKTAKEDIEVGEVQVGRSKGLDSWSIPVASSPIHEARLCT